VSSRSRDVVIVGAGHNGLVAACYLARAGFDVEVVERDTVVGGAVSTVERWPGVRVDRGSSIHVMVRHTDLVEDLQLAELGLVYDDVEPWAVLPHPAGAIRFSADLDQTCRSIEAECGSRDADAYRRFVADWTGPTQAFLDAGSRPPTSRNLGRAAWAAGRGHRGNRAEMVRTFMTPAEDLLATTFTDERLRAAIGWWAGQSGPPPHAIGTAPIAGTIAMFHLRRAGRPRGGSGRLSEALAARLESYGGALRTGDGAASITTGRAGCTVITASGAHLGCRAVISACHVVETARLIGDDAAAASVRVGHGIGMAVRLLTNALPTYPVAVPGIHTAMQLLVNSTAQLRGAYGDFLRGDAANDPPMIVMTPSATDPTLAPAGQHIVTVWAQWHPRVLRSGDWDERRDEVADGIIAAVERWAPGFADSVIDRFIQTPLDLERELGLVGGNVMHVETELDAMFSLRPLPGWSGYRAPRPGVYLCGASTHPGGGVWGASGRNAARVVESDLSGRFGQAKGAYRPSPVVSAFDFGASGRAGRLRRGSLGPTGESPL
jgi:phytoene dehydrogenase-like protein